MSGGSQIFFGAATPACWTVSFLLAHCTHIYNHKYDNSLEEDTLNFVYLILWQH